MQKLTVSLIAALTALFGFGAVANAQYGASGFRAVATPTTVNSSGPVTVTVQGCEPGETLTATLGEQSNSSTCAGANGIRTPGVTETPAGSGNATMTVSAPAAAGTYSGVVASGSTSNTASFSVTVVAQAGPSTGSLPQTGSNGIGTTTTIALGLVAIGVGMLVVTQVRRRRNTFG